MSAHKRTESGGGALDFADANLQDEAGKIDLQTTLDYCPGDVVRTRDGKFVVVKFVGKTHFSENEILLGVEKMTEAGVHNGTVDGISYFTTTEKKGAFMKASDIQKKLYPDEMLLNLDRIAQQHARIVEKLTAKIKKYEEENAQIRAKHEKEEPVVLKNGLTEHPYVKRLQREWTKALDDCGIKIETEEVDPTSNMKITDLKAHFHLSAVGMPKPKDIHDAIDAIADKYASALCSHGKDDSLLNMFAKTESVSWTDPVGTPPHVGIDAIAERIKHLPPMDSVTVKEVFYTMSNEIFLLKVEVHFSNRPKPLTIVDKVILDKEMKIVELSSHFYPKAAKHPSAPAIDLFIQRYVDALWHHNNGALFELFAKEGNPAWTDPVGKPPHVGLESIAARIQKLPPMESVKPLEVFYTLTEKIFLVKVEIQFKGKPNSFIVLDQITLK